MWKLIVCVFVLGGIGLIVSCDENGGLDKTNDFDQRPFIKNLGNNIILPAYQTLAEENASLASAVSALKAETNATTLGEVQAQLKVARLAWQACTPYQFGPADTHNLSNELNVYPIDQSQVNQNINFGTYDLSTLSNLDAKGYQTIGFLVHGDPENQEDVLGSLTTSRLQYMEDVAERINTASQQVYDAWSEDGGNYISEFTSESALGVDIGSSVGTMINAMIRNFERNTRDGKIGIPVGIRSLGETIPESSEAYFAGYSVELLIANMGAYKTLYFGGNDIGLDDYLEAIAAATTGNENLNQTISTQFDKIDAAIENISDPLPVSIQNQKDDVEKVFAEMQTLVALLKTDLASSIGVIISYQDNDGD